MEDVAKGRINCANINEAEWALLEKLLRIGEWFIPTEADWMTAAGVLALVEIRRGYRPISTEEDSDVIEFGWPHIKINHEGVLALSFRRDGKTYQKGEPATILDVFHNHAFITCSTCQGSGIYGGTWDQPEACDDCDGNGFLPY